MRKRHREHHLAIKMADFVGRSSPVRGSIWRRRFRYADFKPNHYRYLAQLTAFLWTKAGTMQINSSAVEPVLRNW